MRIAVLGAGYTGAPLVRMLAASGHHVVAIARRCPVLGLPAELESRVTAGAASTHQARELGALLEGAHRIVHLAPPPRDEAPEEDAERFASVVPSTCERVIYGSTTGVFRRPEDPEQWVDEEAPADPTGSLGQARLRYEETLFRRLSVPVHIVRIAGIYGPHRTLAKKLREGSLVLFEDGPITSRIHRADLVRILAAMVAEAASPPPLVVATDEAPAPTLDVARHTAQLLGLPLPRVLSRDEALSRLTPLARELRTGGKRCRSLRRHDLIGPLRWPTFREGVRAALHEDGELGDAATDDA